MATVWTNGVDSIKVKGGVSLRALQDGVGEKEVDTVCDYEDMYRGYLRDALLNSVHKKVAVEAPEIYDGDIDQISMSLNLEYNTIRNGILPFWDGYFVEMPWEEARAKFEVMGRFIGAGLAIYKGGYPALSSLRPAGYGENSPRRDRNPLWSDVCQIWGWNPGKAERSMWAAREAFNKKFPSQEGKVSWRVIARAILVDKKPGKAAIVARAIQLGWKGHGNYSNARDFLETAIIAEKKATYIDGVVTHIIEKVVKKGNISVYKCVVRRDYTNKFDQVTGHWWEKQIVFTHPKEGSYHYADDTLDKWAWKSAIRAFKSRRKQRLDRKALEAAINAADRCYLVTVEDSYEAGNCIAGTEAWMQENGFSGRKIVPLEEVYEAAIRSGNNLAMNVVKEAVAKIVA